MIQKIKQSFVIKTGIAAAALAFAVVLGAGVLSYHVAGEQLNQTLKNEMDTRAKIIATHLGNELGNIVENLSGTAHNTLFANALADSGGRDNYLKPYLNSFLEVSSIPVRVVLTDFKGQSLITNPVPSLVEPDQDMFKYTVDSGSPQFQITSEKDTIAITLSCPVLYANTGLPEGALVYQFAFNSLIEDIFTKELNHNFQVLIKGPEKDEKYSLLQGNPPPESALFQHSELTAPDIFKGWVFTVEVWENKERLISALKKLAFQYIFLGITGMTVIIPVSLIGARWILARLKALETAAIKVVETKSLARNFPEHGGDEIANLGKAFNHMLGNLNLAYEALKSEANREMKLQSERFRRVLSATLEGYVRIDMNMHRIEEVNDAFCRMTEHSCVMWEGQAPPDFLEGLLKRAESSERAIAWTEEGEIQRSENRNISVLIHCSLDIDEEGNRQMVAFFTDISERKAAEAEMQSVNDQLSRSVNALEKRDRELTLLNRMNDLLLACRSSQEAFEIVRITALKLFPGLSGALAIINPEHQLLETVVHWGKSGIMTPQFSIEECWGMRQGRIHEIVDKEQGLICAHLNKEINQGSLCVPLAVKGKTLGLLWSEVAEQDDMALERMRNLIISLGDAIKLALSNLELREALQDQATKDPLTGLYNRRYFSEVIKKELARSIRSKRSLCIALIDLDHFKSLNDNYGHDAGDKVLIELGKLLMKGVRSSDIAFRFGGEEFLLLLPETDQKGGLECLNGLRTRLEKMSIRHNGKPLRTVTMSVGMAQYPLNGDDEEELIKAADDALYQAKSSGRNRVQIAEG